MSKSILQFPNEENIHTTADGRKLATFYAIAKASVSFDRDSVLTALVRAMWRGTFGDEVSRLNADHHEDRFTVRESDSCNDNPAVTVSNGVLGYVMRAGGLRKPCAAGLEALSIEDYMPSHRAGYLEQMAIDKIEFEANRDSLQASLGLVTFEPRWGPDSRARFLPQVAIEIGFAPMDIPLGGKASMSDHACEKYRSQPQGFRKSNFNRAWTRAIELGLIFSVHGARSRPR